MGRGMGLSQVLVPMELFLIQKLRQHSCRARMGPTARNRRLAFMLRLRTTNYFSPEAILSRQPYIYELHMGNTRPANEPDGAKASCLSSVFMKQADRIAMKERLEKQREEAEEEMSEHDSDDEEKEEVDHSNQDPVEDRKKLLNLIKEMESRFLEGLEEDFDYEQIDEDEELDNDWLEQRGRDEEDAYFDEADTSFVEGRKCEGSGPGAPEEWETMTFTDDKPKDEFK
jgi:hypothetical protein